MKRKWVVVAFGVVVLCSGFLLVLNDWRGPDAGFAPIVAESDLADEIRRLAAEVAGMRVRLGAVEAQLRKLAVSEGDSGLVEADSPERLSSDLKAGGPNPGVNSETVPLREMIAGLARKFAEAPLADALSFEEEFWTLDAVAEPSVDFNWIPDADVYAVECRGEWCRLEVEVHAEDEQQSNPLISELELHLRVSELLGRDVELRFGARDGVKRVVFVR